MNKYLLGALIGLGTIGTTYASIVSRGFLDEALTGYATTTALDLKANQSDLTNLSNIVGTPAEITLGGVMDSVRAIYDLYGGYDSPYYTDTPIPTNDISEFIRRSYTDQNFPGVVGLFVKLFDADIGSEGRWPLRLHEVFDDYYELYDNTEHMSFYQFLMHGGKLISSIAETTVYGLPKLTEKVDANAATIGTVPEGYDNLGAALSAVKGIAEEAKQLAEQAIPNVLDEDSNGKYVLTAEKVGDVATYRWEIINRATNETTTNTTE